MMRADRVFSVLVMSAVLAASTITYAAVPVLADDTIVVNSIYNGADASGGADECDANAATSGQQCTLRAAIQTANADPDTDTITFGFSGRAAKTIKVPNALPSITEPLVIDGYSAPNTRVNTRSSGSNAKLRIVLKGPGGGTAVNALDVAAPSMIKGMVIQAFSEGILIRPGGEGSRVAGNFIGTTPSGMAKARNRSNGVHVDCDAAVTVGGGSRWTRNIISGNGGAGILLCEDVKGTAIKGNLIGVGADNNKDLGNGFAGVWAYGTEDLVIGGDSRLEQNSIAFNRWGGVVLTRAAADSSIAFGVGVLGNSFFRNDGLAIDLDHNGVTQNDGAMDADGGSNHHQNFPGINSARNTRTKTVVRGVMLGEASSAFQIRLFVDVYNEREGKKFLKTITVNTNASGKATWSTKVPRQGAGKKITATATNVTRAPAETSEFAPSKKVKN